MTNKRKYPIVQGWWVYVIQVQSVGKFYIGVSKRKKCSQRWHKSRYVGTALEQYLDEWEDMNKTIIQDNLSKEESYQLEDALIQCLSRYNLCINERRSGLIKASDENAYHREYLKNNPEYNERCKQLNKQWQKDNKEKMREYDRQRNKSEQRKEYKREYQRQLRLKKKLEKQQQQNQLNLF